MSDNIQNTPETNPEAPTAAIVPATRPRLAKDLSTIAKPANRLNQVTRNSFSTREMAGKKFTINSYSINPDTQYGPMALMDCHITVTDETGDAYVMGFEVRSTAKVVFEKLAEIAENDAFPVEVTVVEGRGTKGPYYTLE